MARDWLVVDTHYLAWRAYHSVGRKTPVPSLLAVLREVSRVADLLCVGDVAWAFDQSPYKRADVYPDYKATRRRKTLTDAEAAADDEFRSALDRFRTRDLVRLGYSNVFAAAGYEADDVMAGVVEGLPPGDRAILLTGDKDVYQLLSARCAVYRPIPGEFVTAVSFRRTYGIPPRLMAEVKAVSGCDTDDIPGLDGVAEKTVMKFFRGELAGKPVADRILAYNRSPEYAVARKLVGLPYPGTPRFVPTPDDLPDVREASAVFSEWGLPGPPDGTQWEGMRRVG